MPKTHLKCSHCDETTDVNYEDSRTCYCEPELTYFDWIKLGDDPKPDPNAPVPLCRKCAKEYHEFWDEMWKQYYSGQM